MSNLQKDTNEWQPQWVALRILDFGRIIHKFGSDDKALALWVRQFSEDLIFNNTETEDIFTQQLLEEASETYATRVTAAKKAGKASAKARARKQKNSGSAMPADKREQGEDNTADIVSGDGPEPDNFYDQATMTETSTGEARQSQTGAGAPSVREKSCLEAPAPQCSRRVKPKAPKNAAEVVAWAADHGIDEVDARDWYELNFVIRPGCDKDGVAIENWPGHCISYCRAVKEKRESA